MKLLALLLAATFAQAIPTQAPVRLRQPRAQYTIRAQSFRPVELTRMGAIPMNPDCETGGPPQPIDTPNPVMKLGEKLVVDFIIGEDGKTYSPVFLEGGSSSELRIIKSWRFRPALCNGVPLDSEGVVTFYSLP